MEHVKPPYQIVYWQKLQPDDDLLCINIMPRKDGNLHFTTDSIRTDYFTICTMDVSEKQPMGKCGSTIAKVFVYDFGYDVALATARYICKAVNLHERLLDSVKKQYLYEGVDIDEDARQVIAEAESNA